MRTGICAKSYTCRDDSRLSVNFTNRTRDWSCTCLRANTHGSLIMFTAKNYDIMAKSLYISRIRAPHQHCQRECSCTFMLYSLDLSLTHAHYVFCAEVFGNQTTVWSPLTSGYEQWNMPCTVLTDLCLFFVFLSSVLVTWIGAEWDRCCALLPQIQEGHCTEKWHLWTLTSLSTN